MLRAAGMLLGCSSRTSATLSRHLTCVMCTAQAKPGSCMSALEAENNDYNEREGRFRLVCSYIDLKMVKWDSL